MVTQGDFTLVGLTSGGYTALHVLKYHKVNCSTELYLIIVFSLS